MKREGSLREQLEAALAECSRLREENARLDTLFLATPVSWRGTLQQYAGRLHRRHDSKSVVHIYDYVDGRVPMLKRMHERRLAGYRSIGYRVGGTKAKEKGDLTK